MWEFSDFQSGNESSHNSSPSYANRVVVEEFQPKYTPSSNNIMKDLSGIQKGDSAEENDFCDVVLKYVNQVLMEDDPDDDKASFIQYSTLCAAEKSFYEVLTTSSPSSPYIFPPYEYTSSSSDDSITHCRNNFRTSCINDCYSAESSLISDLQKDEPSSIPNPFLNHTFLTDSRSVHPLNFFQGGDGLVESFSNVPLENQTSWLIDREKDERDNIQSIGDGGTLDVKINRLNSTLVKEKVLQDERDLTDHSCRGRKSLHREDGDLAEERSNKHLEAYVDESVLHEMFDKVLSLYGGNNEPPLDALHSRLPNEASKEWGKSERVKGSNFDVTKKGTNKREAIDMRSLLIQCMQSVAGNDHKSANKLLRQIRSRSSPFGDGSQRLAHYFANSLEARLMGSQSQKYKAIPVRNISDSEVLRALKLYLSAFPFVESSYLFSAEMIMELAARATTLHIIHFGIMYGLQWPPLIQLLSKRPGGPPKLRITGIDFPLAGFRPDVRVKETGRRLAKYCETFNVPFQYDGIAEKWETIDAADLGIEKDEVLVVNCLYQLMHLPDDTILEHSPRDTVLNLIKKIHPDIFIHAVSNGTYNSPFFISRFREALFHFSTLFDMCEAIVPRENQERMVYEREMWGNEIMNVIACEGLERVERPETYKQWHIRTLRAGFRQLPLNQGILKKVRAKVKSGYHKDFFVDEASQWLLEGWKGRVIFAISCWKPA